MKFSRLWEDCTQEEARLEAREEKLGNEENQALTVHARKGKNKVEDRPPRKFQKYQKKKQRDFNYPMLQLPEGWTHCKTLSNDKR